MSASPATSDSIEAWAQRQLEREIGKALREEEAVLTVNGRRSTRKFYKHLPGCKCSTCYKGEVTCKRCGEKFTGGYLALGRHSSLVHARSIAALKRAKRQYGKRELNVGGVPYLLKIARDRGLSSQLDLSAIPRFQVMLLGGLNAKPTARNRMMTKNDRQALESYVERPQGDLVPISGTVTAAMAETIFRLALVTGTAPRNVSSVLIAYGLEHLAQEMRAAKKAPSIAPPMRKHQPEHQLPPTPIEAPPRRGLILP